MKTGNRELALALILILLINFSSILSLKIKTKESSKDSNENKNNDWSFLNYYYQNPYDDSNSNSDPLSPVTSSATSFLNSLGDAGFMPIINTQVKPVSEKDVPKGFVTPKIEGDFSITPGIYGNPAIMNSISYGSTGKKGSSGSYSSREGSNSIFGTEFSKPNGYSTYNSLISDTSSNSNEELKNLIYNTNNKNKQNGNFKKPIIKSDGSNGSGYPGSGNKSLTNYSGLSENNKYGSESGSGSVSGSGNGTGSNSGSGYGNGNIISNYGSGTGSGNGNANSILNNGSGQANGSYNLDQSMKSSYHKINTGGNFNSNSNGNLQNLGSSASVKNLNGNNNSLIRSSANGNSSQRGSVPNIVRSTKNGVETEVINGVTYTIRSNPDKEFELSPDKINKVKKEFHEKKQKIEALISHLKEFDPKKSDECNIFFKLLTN
jgi:hypothetical protein